LRQDLAGPRRGRRVENLDRWTNGFSRYTNGRCATQQTR